MKRFKCQGCKPYSYCELRLPNVDDLAYQPKHCPLGHSDCIWEELPQQGIFPDSCPNNGGKRLSFSKEEISQEYDKIQKEIENEQIHSKCCKCPEWQHIEYHDIIDGVCRVCEKPIKPIEYCDCEIKAAGGICRYCHKPAKLYNKLESEVENAESHIQQKNEYCKHPIIQLNEHGFNVCQVCLKSIKLKQKNKYCKYCNGLIIIRNPTGNCDHLYYPENCNKTFKPK